MNEELEVMRAVLEHSNQIVAICRKGGHNLNFSHVAEKIFGPPRFIALQEDDAERYGLFYPSTSDLIPTSDLPLARALKGETMRDVLIAVRRPGQPEYLLTLNAGPLKDKNGNFYGGVLVGSILDEHAADEWDKSASIDEAKNRSPLGPRRDVSTPSRVLRPVRIAPQCGDATERLPKKTVLLTMKIKEQPKQPK